MEDTNGTRCYTDADTCKLVENTWTNIFKITNEEKAKIDRRNSEHMDAYKNLHNYRTSPYNTTDITQLNVEWFYTRPIDWKKRKTQTELKTKPLEHLE